MKKFKKGAASFYIVAFSTLVLVIIAASFATIVLSAINRASNDELSQSAYDAALAGVEDAKLAYANYRRCKKSGATAKEPDGETITCGNIVWWMENANNSCDMVAHMTGRINALEEGEVLISETVKTNGGESSNLNQAYTCVNIKTKLNDYRANLTALNNVRLVKVKFGDGVAAEHISKIRLSWYSVRENQQLFYSNVDSGDNVIFKSVDEVRPSAPPVIELQIVQTSNSFSLSDLNGESNGDYTDRATLFFAPSDSSGNNTIGEGDVLKSNNQSIKNVPHKVYCPRSNTDDFMCKVLIELPKPIGRYRNDDTFMFLVTLPYGEPDTDFSMEFYKGNDLVAIDGTQVVIDSTGRANDLFRRVETRMESADVSFPYIHYALQMTDDGDADALRKELTVISEYNRVNY